MSSFERLLRPALRGVRANLVPGLVLQLVALALLASYYRLEPVRAAMNRVGELKVRYGYFYSVLSTVLFGGLIPLVILRLGGRVSARRFAPKLVFFVVFWAWRGLEVDAFYRLQGWLFGVDGTVASIAKKVLCDQFVYNPLWAAPASMFAMLLNESGYSWARLRGLLEEMSALARVTVVLLSTWVVWLPSVTILYTLPSALQLPFSNLVLCFWCLLLQFVTQTSEAA